MRRLTILLGIAAAVILAANRNTAAISIATCPAVGDATGCAVVIDISPLALGSPSVATSPSIPAGLFFYTFPGGFIDPVGDDPLIGVTNDTSSTVDAITLTGPGIFAFDGDGLCSGSWTGTPTGCPFDLTLYAGPGTSFSGYDSLGNVGVVNFTGGLAPGASAYFSLQDAPTGGNPGSAIPEPASFLLLGTALSGLSGVLRKRIWKA